MSSSRSIHRVLAGFFAGALLVAGAPAVAAADPLPDEVGIAAWTDGPCTGSSGVTVVVDFTGHAGGEVVRRCTDLDPATAFAALTDVDVAPEHGVGEGEAGPYQYLCRIDGLPSATDDSCTGFLPDASYWAFWVPDVTGTAWGYADEGVDTYDPPSGDVLGFSFGAGTAADPNEMSLTLAEALDPDWVPAP
ncbi:hypothetical protein [Actinoalloteichus hymeniacidonis]|jgi:hypothetical protein|uniref:Secreted protein n=1 Tax=Actinoalloteichus hymeniacidonis TaxID=340345 RepID=A0AAC9HQJ6_9PSEU|nr:hypothetical protein [Actinoalloteichus hymeniacidonis]AOS63503.1 hypothetical protein TL08_13445 [Actinoalloteichus hymeniacidonis]MBB5908453.1 hypothetical protein [Actinoalloteichus hymeniacidonis]